MCEEFEFHQDRSGQPDVLMGQLIVLSESRQKFLCRTKTRHTRMFYCNSMKNEIKLLSQENKKSKFCKEAGFMRVVEVDSIS